MRLTSSGNRAYVRRLQQLQDRLASRIVSAIPGSFVRWRYSVVLDGMAVVVPRTHLRELASVPGIAQVWPNAFYGPADTRSQQVIGAPQLWGSDLSTAGQGMKIGVIDEGVEQSHPFFDSTGFTYPAGYPKGDTRYTTPKVIVARAFAPSGTTYAAARLPFDPALSFHGTHVAGIAAGDFGVLAEGARLSGIAPRAQIGNYKALGVPTPGFGLDGNAPEIAAAIEAAVTDGMNVINLSLGENEIEPARDIVVKALDAAADAGVVPVVAAGNEFADFGHGSIGSPGNAPKAITVAATTGGQGSPTADRIASFSSGGPTPYSLQMKPDVAAPGVAVLSSVPGNGGHGGSWEQISGTSMATPHVAGAAALLKQRHPDWTVGQIKSALVITGAPVREGGKEVAATREGGGRIDLVRADNPLVFAQPSSLSFGLLRPGASASRTIALSDAGGGPAPWSVRVIVQVQSAGLTFVRPASASAPGSLNVGVRVGRPAAERDVTGFVVLARAGSTRRIPFWFRVERPRLALDHALVVSRPGTYRGTTVGAGSRVATYRYPDLAVSSFEFVPRLAGPEVVYRFDLKRPVANFGVVLTSHARGVELQPRIVRNDDENQLAGYTALPLDVNPYRSSYGATRPAAGVVLPRPGVFDIVFDSLAQSRRGAFTFRLWVDDTAPPTVRPLGTHGGFERIAVVDSGAGVDPASLRASIDGRSRAVAYANGVARISLAGLARGNHALVFRVADFQETKNSEDVGPILPNTRVLKKTIAVP